MKLLALDTETHLIGPCAVAPKLVCVTLAYDDVTEIYSHVDPDLEGLLLSILQGDYTIVGQNIAYDMGVIASYFPNLILPIFKAYDDQRIHCTRIREKEIVLAQTGNLKFEVLPDGGNLPRRFSLQELAMRYLGEDLSDSKNAEDSWRLNFSMLDGLQTSEYPEEARQYAMRDAALTLRVYEAQASEYPTHAFHAAVDFALFLTTCYGIAIDPEERQKIEDMLTVELSPEKTRLLLATGILDPGEDPRPKKNGELTKGKKPSIKQAPLHAKIKEVCEKNGIEVKYTPTERVSADADVLDLIAHFDPVLEEYAHRQALQKLVTTELPRINAPVVHPSFDVLKESGRVSSMASDLYPSCNIQNVDPRVRPCYIPRPGHLFLSVDYSSIELVTLAQKLLDLFGRSLLANLINAGINPHEFLGAQMAYAFVPHFQEACQQADLSSREDIYRVFHELKKSDVQEEREFFKKYRTFAKPTGLGYPGGLGAETFVTYAKGTFGVVITVEQAVQFKKIWFDTYPEMHEYFKWITWSCKDPNHPGEFAYVSPMGMLRSNVGYCPASNGAGMQTPAAEGGKLAYYEAVRACFDYVTAPAEGLVSLFGCRPQAWIHDEIMLMIPDDEFCHERALALSKVMVDCMRQITPDVAVTTEAKLMRRWYKEAESVFDQAGRLVPWIPQTKETHS